MRTMWGAGVAALALLASGAAGADVKTGVDAWARGDYRTAVEEWRGPAIAGDPDAQFNLAQAYKLGRGVPVDPGLAESWFRKAALQHHAQAEDNYGLALYQSGRKAEALPWLEKSVARGEPRTELVLGTMLFNGDGVPRDVPRAYALMTRASAAGLPAASETLAQMDGYVSAADREKGTALAARLAAERKPDAPVAGGRRVVVAGSGPLPADPAAAQASAPPPAPPSASPRGRQRAPAAARTEPVKLAAPARPEPAKVAAKPDPAPAGPMPAKPAPAPARVAAAKPAAPAPAPAPAGRYRVQLGAFRDEGNAKALWSRVGGRIGGSPAYPRTGKLTRLVAGGFATEADARRACRTAGVTCVVTR